MMSKVTWEKLPNDVKNDIMASAKIAQEYERQLFVNVEKELFEDLKKNYKVQIYSPPDMNKWREKITSVYEKNAKEVGGMDYIKAIQGL
jgi:TRAP-type C4-dicarboxylate transport system substrate-binding protein